MRKERMMNEAASAELARSTAIEEFGNFLVRYGLVVVIAWIGAMKFTGYEAAAIRGLVSNSPLLSWTYGIFDVQTLSSLVGLVEVVIALLIALRPISARLSAVGSLLAIPMFLTTLSFLITAPSAFEPSLGGFPGLSVLPGQFLIKDLVLLGAAVWMLADSLQAVKRA
jgi:uncharacterized membrane protein YkgB